MSALRAQFQTPYKTAESSPLRVFNHTRNTLLATAMEVADSAPKRNKGLLGRKFFPTGEGLWIIPCQSVHTFFMQFPIDLVYLDRKNGIRKLRYNVPPWRMSACFSAHSIIELPSGTIQQTRTCCGDILEISPVQVASSKS
jgi:hypothetical protein